VTLAPQHQKLIDESGIDPEVADERGYFTALTKAELKELGFPPSQLLVPTLVVPVYSVQGELATYQHRPDRPRLNREGKPIKYETRARSQVVIDVPHRARPGLQNRNVPLLVTEGSRKADAAVSKGLCCVALLGVWNWRDADGLLPDWEYIGLKERRVYVVFDSDVMEKPAVYQSLCRLKALLEHRGAEVRVIYLPAGEGGSKTGLDDFLAARTVDDLLARAVAELRRPQFEDGVPPIPTSRVATVMPCSLDDVLSTFRRYLHLPDADSLIAVLGAYAANRLPGPPVWFLLVGPPSGGKTEQVLTLAHMPDVRLASVLTEGALLSGVPAREHAQGAKGGLLREIGAFGYLLLKDFTSILSMNRDSRAVLLGTLREIYDGSWTRHVGTDGGKVLHWEGKIGLVAGCTPALDTHHSVMASLGERFLLYRQTEIDDDRVTRRALHQENDDQHRVLGEVVAGLLSTIPAAPALSALTEAEEDYLVAIARVAVRGRSPVERDPSASKEIVQVPEAEVPARLAQALHRLLSGMLLLGCERETAWRIVRHVALSSMPAVRLRALEQLGASAWPRTAALALAMSLPTNTTNRTLEDLFVHGLVERRVEKGAEPGAGKPNQWNLADWARAAFAAPLPVSPLSCTQKSVVTDTGNIRPLGLKTDDRDRVLLEVPTSGDSLVGRRSACWRCRADVDSDSDATCDACGWIVCRCGACGPDCDAGAEAGQVVRALLDDDRDDSDFCSKELFVPPNRSCDERGDDRGTSVLLVADRCKCDGCPACTGRPGKPCGQAGLTGASEVAGLCRWCLPERGAGQ